MWMTRRRSEASKRLVRSRLSTALVTTLMAIFPALAINAEEATDIARRADGRPDLSGTYDTATLTPLVRPAQFGDRLTLTEEEAAALAEHWRTNFEADHQPSDPNREAPPEGGVGIYAPEFTGAAGKVGGYNAFFVDIGDNAFMLDGKYRTSIITDPPDGRRPPLSETGKKLAAAAAPLRHENTGTAWWLGLEAGPYDHIEQRPLGERCILSRGRSGPPSLPAMYNNLKRIVQTDDYVTILAEQMHDARIIRLDGEGRPPAHGELPRLMGDSVGHWDGDTLVVDTINFRQVPGDSGTLEGLHVVERISRMENGDLRYKFTVEDPRYTAPWSGEYPWPATDTQLYEYACHEGNYAMGNIMRGARLLEEETRASGETP
jgi:hypothetical protein